MDEVKVHIELLARSLLGEIRTCEERLIAFQKHERLNKTEFTHYKAIVAQQQVNMKEKLVLLLTLLETGTGDILDDVRVQM